MDRAHKEDLMLYGQILTNDYYHSTYNTMSVTDQKILKDGVRKLVQMGIDGKGSGKDNYINEDDIRNVFFGKTFAVRSRKTGKNEHSVPILSEYVIDSSGKKTLVGQPGLWDYHFSNVDLRDKLRSFNSKIEVYKKTFQQTNSKKQAFMAFLSFKYQIALTRFYNDATEFANFLNLGSLLKPTDPNYVNLLLFGDRHHFDISKALYRLTIPLYFF